MIRVIILVIFLISRFNVAKKVGIGVYIKTVAVILIILRYLRPKVIIGVSVLNVLVISIKLFIFVDSIVEGVYVTDILLIVHRILVIKLVSGYRVIIGLRIIRVIGMMAVRIIEWNA